MVLVTGEIGETQMVAGVGGDALGETSRGVRNPEEEIGNEGRGSAEAAATVLSSPSQRQLHALSLKNSSFLACEAQYQAEPARCVPGACDECDDDRMGSAIGGMDSSEANDESTSNGDLES